MVSTTREYTMLSKCGSFFKKAKTSECKDCRNIPLNPKPASSDSFSASKCSSTSAYIFHNYYTYCLHPPHEHSSARLLMGTR